MANNDNFWEHPDDPGQNPNDDTNWTPDDPYNQAPQPPRDSGNTPPKGTGLTYTSPFVTPIADAEGEGGPEGFGGGGGGFPTRPSTAKYLPVPQFKAPVFAYREFAPPTFQDAMNEPGYQFRLAEGERALQQSAAGRGQLRTGGTLKDILGYGQNYAAQEYGNVYNRALNTYGTQFGAAKDIYDRNYTGAKDEYAPNLLQWQFLTNAEQRAREAEYQAALQRWMHDNLSAYEYGQLAKE